MTLYNLVFSDQRSVRFRRHLLFWTAWCIYLAITYLIPTNWIPAWNLRGPMPHIYKYGIALASLRILSAAILLALVHAALVYGILYFFLPRYVAQKGPFTKKNKNWIITTVLLLLVVWLMAFVNYFNFVLSFYLSTRVGYFDAMPGMAFIIPRWGRQILFNYPTVVGFALAIKLMKDWYV